MMKNTIPAWAAEVLQCPMTSTPLQLEGDRLMTADGTVRAGIVDGVVRFVLPGEDPSIRFYRAAGGAHFQERSRVGYAMTTLDTSVYHGYLSEFRPDDTDALIVDVGGGDGRNARPWLDWGYRRLVVVDAAGEALQRFRARIAERSPEWLDRMLFIEADARRLPLKSGLAARIFSIEALAYLNEDYDRGLSECARVMADAGRLLVADRDYEGSLLARLFYVGGVAGLLEQAGGRDATDGNAEHTVRSRCFTADELASEVSALGLRIVASYGVSALSLILGYLRNVGKLAEGDEERLADVHRLIVTLGREGAMRRSHVIIAERERA
jgi:SAM-dependent methyltransferase